MQPRLPQSKKFTPMPGELLGQVKQVFAETFSKVASEGKFLMEGRIYQNEILFQAGYLEEGRIRQANFVVSMEYDPQKQNALQMIHFVVDCAASMMDAYFEADQNLDEFPLEWEEFKAQGKTAYIKVDTTNSELEAQADALLGEEDSGNLVQGEDIAEDRKAVVTMLGLDDEGPGEDDETH